MQIKTAETLRRLHHRLHTDNIPHDCREYYQAEARLLYENIARHANLYPIPMFTLHEGQWN